MRRRARPSQVYHFAAQVAVTTSVADPVDDFEINLQGTLNLLEALRATPAPLVFASTNKVYGKLAGLELVEGETRYAPAESSCVGTREVQPLDFHSPYGCSKGRRRPVRPRLCAHLRPRYGCVPDELPLRPASVRHRGPGLGRAFPDRARCADEPITIFGDGKQVRDILFVDDVVEAIRAGATAYGTDRGHAFNIGGGAAELDQPARAA